MSLTINTTAADKNLTVLATVKAELNISTTDDDDVMTALIRQASDAIVKYTGREFARETVTELLPSFGGTKLMLTRTPVSSVIEVKYDGSTISSTKYAIDDAEAGIIFNEAGWTRTTLEAHYVERIVLSEGRRDWSFNYVGGYITPGGASTTSSTTSSTIYGERDLPRDIERACIDIVKTYFYRRESDPRIKSQRVGETSETLFDTVDFPSATKALLDRYCRVDI